MIKSVQAEDKGTYICTIKQPRGFESSREESQSMNVMVMGKMKKKCQLRRVESSIQDKKLLFSDCMQSPVVKL